VCIVVVDIDCFVLTRETRILRSQTNTGGGRQDFEASHKVTDARQTSGTNSPDRRLVVPEIVVMQSLLTSHIWCVPRYSYVEGS
jgi:hypothetical protein